MTATTQPGADPAAKPAAQSPAQSPAQPASDLRAELRECLARLESTDEADPTGGVELFHETFLSLDPNGVAVVTREQLRAALPMRAQLFRSVGASDNRLRDLDVRPLDDRHVLAETRWELGGEDGTQEPIELGSTYLLRREAGDWHVVAYLNHQDLGAVLAARRAD